MSTSATQGGASENVITPTVIVTVTITIIVTVTVTITSWRHALDNERLRAPRRDDVSPELPVRLAACLASRVAGPVVRRREDDRRAALARSAERGIQPVDHGLGAHRVGFAPSITRMLR